MKLQNRKFKKEKYEDEQQKIDDILTTDIVTIL